MNPYKGELHPTLEERPTTCAAASCNNETYSPTEDEWVRDDDKSWLCPECTMTIVVETCTKGENECDSSNASNTATTASRNGGS